MGEDTNSVCIKIIEHSLTSPIYFGFIRYQATAYFSPIFLRYLMCIQCIILIHAINKKNKQP